MNAFLNALKSRKRRIKRCCLDEEGGFYGEVKYIVFAWRVTALGLGLI